MVDSATTKREYITPGELADKLGIARKTIWRQIQRGRIPGVIRLGQRCIRIHAPTIERRLLSGALLLSDKA